MNKMLTINATDVRKEWSLVIDNAIREKPQFIRRTRDYMVLSDIEFLKNLLEPYEFSVKKIIEEDDSVTLELNEIDLVVNSSNLESAKIDMAMEILEYAEDFYNDFNYWIKDENRKKHIPYVFKALILDDVQKIGELIKCRSGRS